MVKKAKTEPSPSGQKSQNRTVPKWLNCNLLFAVGRKFSLNALSACLDNVITLKSIDFNKSVFIGGKGFVGAPFFFDKVTTYHNRVDGGLEAFDFMTEESEGTKVAAGLVGVCLWAIERGAVVFFDELDRSLHPIVLLELVRMFKRKSSNPHGAQLVFTLHDTTILEDPTTRVSEVAIVNNNMHTGTTMTRLSELDKEDGRGVRNIHNFRKQYMEGLLSGVPHPLQ